MDDLARILEDGRREQAIAETLRSVMDTLRQMAADPRVPPDSRAEAEVLLRRAVGVAMTRYVGDKPNTEDDHE